MTDLASSHFGTHLFDHFGCGTDENQTGLTDPSSKLGVLGKEAVAGMNRFGACALGGCQEGLDASVFG